MAIATGTAEQPLRLVWPPWKPPPGEGVIAVVTVPELTRGWIDALLARVDDQLYGWVPADGMLEERATEILGRPGVVAATVAPASADPRHLGLALEVACRLAARRSDGGVGSWGACLTSWSPPDPPPAHVRVPHLLSVWHGSHITDSVVWEVLRPSAARRWLGFQPRPADLSFVESNLDRLVRLRTATRLGDLLPTAAAARLLSQVGPDRDLPISLVYRRPELFRALFQSESTDPY